MKVTLCISKAATFFFVFVLAGQKPGKEAEPSKVLISSSEEGGGRKAPKYMYSLPIVNGKFGGYIFLVSRYFIPPSVHTFFDIVLDVDTKFPFFYMYTCLLYVR